MKILCGERKRLRSISLQVCAVKGESIKKHTGEEWRSVSPDIVAVDFLFYGRNTWHCRFLMVRCKLSTLKLVHMSVIYPMTPEMKVI